MKKMKLAKNSFRPSNFLFLTAAGIINAVGVTLFLTPALLYDGGFSGTSVFLAEITPLPLSVYLLILNIPFFLIGLKKLGLPFIVYSVYAIGIYSLFAYLFQYAFKINFDNGSPIAGQEKLLCALFGGLISGVGSGLTIRYGGAIDGVEVMAVLFAKKIGVTVGIFVMAYNAVLYVTAGAITGNWINALYSVVAYAIGLKAVDFVIEGLDKAKSALIVTEKTDAVASALSEEFGRGITVFDAKGYYSDTDKSAIFCVVNRFELNKMKKIVTDNDPDSFVVVNEVTDSLGSSLKYKRSVTKK